MEFLDFYKKSLLGPDWGEQVQFVPGLQGYTLSFSMMSQNMTVEEMGVVWQPFTDWLDQGGSNTIYCQNFFPKYSRELSRVR